MITEAMKAREGKILNAQVTRIDQRLVDQYLDATGDSDLVWRDKAVALGVGYSDVPVPPGLLTSMQMEGGSPSGYIPEQVHLGGALDGGGEWEFLLPVYVGDVIFTTRELINIKERRGKLGEMIINTFEVTYRNQRSETVARGRWSTIRYATEG
ncbi:MAG: MaoC family dehydratase [Desulfobacteria bacterium]